MRAQLFSRAVMLSCVLGVALAAEHSHPPPEKLGRVDFRTSCSPQVAAAFNRGVALLHSFAYTASEEQFRDVARADPGCAMAHWGIALSYFHPLWAPPDAEHLRLGIREIDAARGVSATPREKEYIEAVGSFYRDSERIPHLNRARAYEQAMAAVAAHYPDDTEARIFYSLALLATASPTDGTHANQKRAAEILEPLYRKFPEHPGLAHYLIHAYDSSELASRGLAAARAYSRIAPAAPHALHMPSHIFTRMGLWEDSVTANLAARQAAHAQGDIGEELHAMDYLAYAYIQLGQFNDAERIVGEVTAMTSLEARDFKVGYAANAMPVRLAIERGQWASAAALQPLPDSGPQVAAIVYWAAAVGKARDGHPERAAADLAKIKECHEKLRATGNSYWAAQTTILEQEARAWVAVASGDAETAISLMGAAAIKEEGIEKLPVTPGPIVPAREQLGEIFLASGRPTDALREFQAALQTAPRRRGALIGAATAVRGPL
jgi:tetratricopeptide (TPR) repeat protein